MHGLVCGVNFLPAGAKTIVCGASAERYVSFAWWLDLSRGQSSPWRCPVCSGGTSEHRSCPLPSRLQPWCLASLAAAAHRSGFARSFSQVGNVDRMLERRLALSAAKPNMGCHGVHLLCNEKPHHVGLILDYVGIHIARWASLRSANYALAPTWHVAVVRRFPLHSPRSYL